MTADEIAVDAAACQAAGASVYHLHVRDGSGAPTMEVAAYRAAHEAIRARCDLIVQFSSGGGVHDSEDERIAPLELRPEMATLTTGSVNFGDEIFSNPMPLVARFYKRMRDLDILPEFEIFEAGMIENAVRICSEFGDGHHQHYDFVLGVQGGLPFWDDSLEFLLAHLPPGATFSATGIGRHNFAVAQRSIALGGHVRTGFEDVRFIERGVLAHSNAELVVRIVELGRSVGREPASPHEARQLLGLE